jgi:hypothetical protein
VTFCALFGFFACIGLHAPLWAYVIGFLCVLLDENDMATKLKGKK